MNRLPFFAILVIGLTSCAPPQPQETTPSREAEVAAQQPPETKSREAIEASALPVFRGHTKAVEWAAFSSDFAKLVTVSNYDCTGRVWDAKTGRELCQFTIPKLDAYGSARRGVFFTANNRKIVTENATYPGLSDIAFRVWDAETGRLLRELREADEETRKPKFGSPGGNGGTDAIIYSATGKVKMENSTSVRIYDAATGKPLVGYFGAKLVRGEAALAPDYMHVIPGTNGVQSAPSGRAVTDDGTLALFYVSRYTIHNWTEPPSGTTYPVYPDHIYRYIDQSLVLIDIDQAKEVKQIPVPQEWGSFQLYFFRNKQPFALVSDKEGTILKLVAIFP